MYFIPVLADRACSTWWIITPINIKCKTHKQRHLTYKITLKHHSSSPFNCFREYIILLKAKPTILHTHKQIYIIIYVYIFIFAECFELLFSIRRKWFLLSSSKNYNSCIKAVYSTSTLFQVFRSQEIDNVDLWYFYLYVVVILHLFQVIWREVTYLPQVVLLEIPCCHV